MPQNGERPRGADSFSKMELSQTSDEEMLSADLASKGPDSFLLLAAPVDEHW
jgi:hypothetical protein